MPSPHERLGAIMARIRQERGLSQAETASRCGFGQAAVSKWERGINRISLPAFLVWANLVDLTIKEWAEIQASAVFTEDEIAGIRPEAA